jgi:Domain of unknown function (DUF3859)
VKGVFVVFALLLGIAFAAAQTPMVSKANITRVGIFEAQPTGTPGVSGSSTGYNYHFLSNSPMVPARKGIQFGFEYRLVGEPQDATVSLRSVTLFPDAGLVNPDTGQATARSENVIIKNIGPLYLTGYKFEKDWELVPGMWIMQIWCGD